MLLISQLKINRNTKTYVRNAQSCATDLLGVEPAYKLQPFDKPLGPASDVGNVNILVGVIAHTETVTAHGIHVQLDRNSKLVQPCRIAQRAVDVNAVVGGRMPYKGGGRVAFCADCSRFR